MLCTDQQAADSSREVAQQQGTDSLSILDGADYAASAVDVVEPTLEQFTDADDVADELASAAEQLEEALTAPQATDALMGEDIAGEVVQGAEEYLHGPTTLEEHYLDNTSLTFNTSWSSGDFAGEKMR